MTSGAAVPPRAAVAGNPPGRVTVLDRADRDDPRAAMASVTVTDRPDRTDLRLLVDGDQLAGWEATMPLHD